MSSNVICICVCLILIHKCICGLAPTFLLNNVGTVEEVCACHTKSSDAVNVYLVKGINLTTKSFLTTASEALNNLPDDVRNVVCLNDFMFSSCTHIYQVSDVSLYVPM